MVRWASQYVLVSQRAASLPRCHCVVQYKGGTRSVATFAMTATHIEHQSQAPALVRCAVITVSDTRTLENDTGGKSVIDHLKAAGHSVVCRDIIRDEPALM